MLWMENLIVELEASIALAEMQGLVVIDLLADLVELVVHKNWGQLASKSRLLVDFVLLFYLPNY